MLRALWLVAERRLEGATGDCRENRVPVGDAGACTGWVPSGPCFFPSAVVACESTLASSFSGILVSSPPSRFQFPYLSLPFPRSQALNYCFAQRYPGGELCEFQFPLPVGSTRSE